LLEQSAAQAAAVLAPKVAGGWHLHELTRPLPLDFFLLLSSAAALLGSPGQAAYGAANGFLDGLAHYRRGLGLPGVSVALGPMAGVGLAAGSEAAWARRGATPLAVDEALRLALTQLNGDCAHLGLMAIDWARFTAAVGQKVALLDGLAGPRPIESAADERLAELRAEPSPQRRRERLQHEVRAAAARVLGGEAGVHLESERPLRDYGLDSLMALDLAKALGKLVGKSLPPTLLFNHSSIAALTSHLDELLGAAPPATAPAAPPSLGEANAVARMSERELEALVDAELAKLLTNQGLPS
jgi:acyl carrier protein